MIETNLALLPEEELPVTDEAKKKKPKVNCLQDMVLELMEEFKLKDADIVKGTGISWSTWHGWIMNEVDCQLADQNLLSLWMYLNKFKRIHLETLVYGIGEAESFDKDEER